MDSFSNAGQHWFPREDELLLEELNNNIDIHTIAHNHKRTLGSINARRRLIAGKMYLKKFSIEEIMNKTKLDERTIIEIMYKKDNYKSKNSLLENDIEQIKHTLQKLVDFVYKS
jgi:uncharacterized protein YlzI (FlbEa/FlbD family)